MEPITPASRQQSRRAAALATRSAVQPDAAIALYPRVSSDEQVKGQGIPVQMESMTRHLKMRAVGRPEEASRAVRIFQEDYTATTLDRPELNRLRAEVRAGKIATVIFFAPDRVARNVKDALVLIDELHRAGVAVEFSTMAYANTDEGRHALTMFFAFAEYEGRRIRARTSAAKLSAIAAGIYARRPIFGYRREGKAVVVHETNGPIVQRAFALLASGVGIIAIARTFNAEGLTTQHGRFWGGSTLRQLLRCETYCGTAYFNQQQVVGAETERGPRGGRVPIKVDIPREEWLPVAVPPLVDRATFGAVQTILDANRSGTALARAGRPGRGVALLRGLGVCGTCGMRVYADTGNVKNLPRYRCSSRVRGRCRPCGGPTWHVLLVDEAVRTAVLTFAADPARLCATLMRQRGRDREKVRERLTRLERARTVIEGKLTRAYSLYVQNGGDRAQLDALTRALQRERDLLEVEIALARGQSQTPAPERITDWGAEMAPVLREASAEKLAALLSAVCTRAEMTPREIVLHVIVDRLAPTAAGPRAAGVTSLRGDRQNRAHRRGDVPHFVGTQPPVSAALSTVRVRVPLFARTRRGGWDAAT